MEFVPLGVATVTSVKIQAAIGKYGYQHIGTPENIAVNSLMRTSVKISSLRQQNWIIFSHSEYQ